MAKLLDILNNIIYKGNSALPGAIKPPDHFDDKQKKALNDAAKQLAALGSNAAKIAKDIDFYNQKLTEAKVNIQNASTAYSKDLYKDTAKKINAKIIDLEDKHQKVENSVQAAFNKIQKKFDLNQPQLDGLYTHITENADEFKDSVTKTKTSMGLLSNITKGGFHDILSNTKEFFGEFGLIGDAIALALYQMEELNKKMVEFNRKMSLGFSNNMLGMDLYGSSGRGSLTTIAGKNNISEEQFLSAFSGLAKGNQSGNTNDFMHDQENMVKFGVQAGQLSKFYGVQMSTINTVTSNLVYNFGAKIKDLNEVFADGKEKAAAAGISVSEYFERLKEATDDLGKHYVKGGIKGREDLALYAAKTGRSIDDIMKVQDRFTDFTSQYEIQNRAAAMGLNNTAQNIAKIWSKGYLGDVKQSDKLYTGSLAQDIKNYGGVDKDGFINTTGQKNLHDFGASAADIQAVQRMLTLDKQGISITEQQLDIDKQSLVTKQKIANYERKNATIGEQLEAQWKKLSGAVLDPMKKVLGPLVDGLLLLTGAVVDFITPILKLVLTPLYEFGKYLTSAIDALSDFIQRLKNSWIGKLMGAGDKKLDEYSSSDEKHPIMGLVGGWMAYKVAKKLGKGVNNIWQKGKGLLGDGTAATEATVAENAVTKGSKLRGLWQGAKSAPSNLWNGAKGLFGKAAGSETAEAFRTVTASGKGLGMMKGLKGFGIGTAITMGADYLGGKMGGKAGSNLSTIASDAGYGLMVGQLLAPFTAGLSVPVGAALGTVVGIVHASWDKISDVWSDGSKSWWEKCLGTADAISDTITETLNGIGDYSSKKLKQFWDYLMGNEEKKDDLESNKNAIAAAMNFMDTSKAVQNVIEQRRIATPNAAEKAQEDRMQKEFKPYIAFNVTNSFDGSTKAAVLAR